MPGVSTVELTGLSTEAARVIAETDGPNALPRPAKSPAWRLFLSQLTHFFAVDVLGGCCRWRWLAGMAPLAVAIVVIVISRTACFAFAQEHHRLTALAAELES